MLTPTVRGSKNQVASGSESMATECVGIPIFTGADLRSWISWLEKFFVREDFTDDDDKLNFAQSFMEGEAILWFQWRQSLWLLNSWEALKKSLWLRFGSDEDPENIMYNTEIQKGLEQLRRNLLIFIIR